MCIHNNTVRQVVLKLSSRGRLNAFRLSMSFGMIRHRQEVMNAAGKLWPLNFTLPDVRFSRANSSASWASANS